MLILRNPKMDTDGKNYLVNECVDIFKKTMVFKLELQDTIMFMALLVPMMVVEKKHQLHCVEKL